MSLNKDSLGLTVTKKQSNFLHAAAFEVLYGGAAGGGKSYGQMIDAFIYAMKYPASRQIIFRRTFAELEKSLIRTALTLYPQSVFRYQKTVHTGTFINGSLIDFAYCDSEDDVYKYQSSEYDVIRFVELTHFTESMYVYLISRCRGTNCYPKQIKSTTNPGGIGHSWVKSRFIDIGAPEKIHTVGEITRQFIPATVYENKFLMQSDPDYVKRLKSLSERDRRALLDGEWELSEGRYFTDFERSLHVTAPFPLSDVNYYVAIDYGLDMLAGLKIAVDCRGNCFVVNEVYKSGLIVSKAAEEIRALIATDRVRAVFAPPDLWSRQKESGLSIASLFSKNGVTLTRVSNGRVAGWMALKEYLAPTVDEAGEKSARLKIFDNCINLIRTLGGIQCDSENPCDCSVTPHELTHAPDALRYFVSGNPAAPHRSAAPCRYGFSFEKPKRSACGVGDKIKII